MGARPKRDSLELGNIFKTVLNFSEGQNGGMNSQHGHPTSFFESSRVSPQSEALTAHLLSPVLIFHKSLGLNDDVNCHDLRIFMSILIKHRTIFFHERYPHQRLLGYHSVSSRLFGKNMEESRP